MLKNENKRIRDGRCAQLRTIAFQLYARSLRVLGVCVNRVRTLDLFVYLLCIRREELRKLVIKIDSFFPFHGRLHAVQRNADNDQKAKRGPKKRSSDHGRSRKCMDIDIDVPATREWAFRPIGRRRALVSRAGIRWCLESECE